VEPAVDNLQTLETLGFALPTAAYLIGMLLFSLIGLAAFRYGGKRPNPPVRWIGLALMLYPYAVSDTLLLYVVGAALCGAIYWYRN
jgi:hypothetical protein